MKKSALVLVLIMLSVLVKAQNYSNGTVLNDDQLQSLLVKVGLIVLAASVISFLVWLFKKEKS